MMNENEMKKQVLKMGIRSEDGWIYFNELLYRAMRRVYGNFKLNKKMQILELKTQFKIFMLTMTARKIDSKATDSEKIFDTLVDKNQSVNPFLTMMYFKISFNAWLSWARKKQFEIEHPGKKMRELSKSANVVVQIEVEEIVEVTSEEESESEMKSMFGKQVSPMSQSGLTKGVRKA